MHPLERCQCLFSLDTNPRNQQDLLQLRTGSVTVKDNNQRIAYRKKMISESLADSSLIRQIHQI